MARPTQNTPAPNAGTSLEAAWTARRVFPEPPGPESDETCAVAEQIHEPVPLSLPAYERGCRPRQVGVRDRLQRRETLAADLEEGDRFDEVLQTVLAQLDEVALDELPRPPAETTIFPP